MGLTFWTIKSKNNENTNFWVGFTWKQMWISVNLTPLISKSEIYTIETLVDEICGNNQNFGTSLLYLSLDLCSLI